MLKKVVSSVILWHNFQFLFNVALAYLIIAVIYYIKKLSRVLGITVFALVETIMFGLFVCQMFLYDHFGMEISAFSLQLLNETNSGEASEFLSVYVFQTSSVKYICITAFLLFLQVSIHLWGDKLKYSFFEEGSAELNIEETRGTLLRLSEFFKLPELAKRSFRIEGHTDSTPVAESSRFESNWELSAARSMNVLHYLADYGADENRFSIAGYADTKPKFSNDTPEGRAYNRRVDIIILDEGHF